MAWDWVPPREGDRTRPPSRRLATIVTVLTVVLAVVVAAYWIAGPANATMEQCVADRPRGVTPSQVSVAWQWWPPKKVCRYDKTAVEAMTGARSVRHASMVHSPVEKEKA